ncbi:MAG: hypothetical protein JW882_11085 [Deltaproteobacteria bacterium]|nr:hypothetical protein [Deltaproteobacteria bacterium]
MSNSKYFALAGQGTPTELPFSPREARVGSVWMDGDVVEGCMFNEACWYVSPFKGPELLKHNSDEVLFFIGGDPNDPENLNAEIEMCIENDKLTLKKTSAVFVPEGVAHGKLEVKNLTRPVFHYSCHLNTSKYEAFPAEATAAPGSYNRNWVEKYVRPDGKLPEAPEGFLKFLLFLDGKRLKGAPYAEAVWFCTTNDTGPAPHIHEDFDEFIGFIGSDPEHPGELNGEVSFYIEDEMISSTKSCLVYVPRGVRHSPIYIPKLECPIIHFSGGNGGDYVRKGTHGEGNLFRM